MLKRGELVGSCPHFLEGLWSRVLLIGQHANAGQRL